MTKYIIMIGVEVVPNKEDPKLKPYVFAHYELAKLFLSNMQRVGLINNALIIEESNKELHIASIRGRKIKAPIYECKKIVSELDNGFGEIYKIPKKIIKKKEPVLFSDEYFEQEKQKRINLYKKYACIGINEKPTKENFDQYALDRAAMESRISPEELAKEVYEYTKIKIVSKK